MSWLRVIDRIANSPQRLQRCAPYPDEASICFNRRYPHSRHFRQLSLAEIEEPSSGSNLAGRNHRPLDEWSAPLSIILPLYRDEAMRKGYHDPKSSLPKTASHRC